MGFVELDGVARETFNLYIYFCKLYCFFWRFPIRVNSLLGSCQLCVYSKKKNCKMDKVSKYKDIVEEVIITMGELGE